MKKLILIISTLFLSVGSVFSQYIYSPGSIPIDKYHVLDSAYLKCSYKLSFVLDTLKADKTYKEDMHTLLVGKTISKYYSQNLLDYCMKVEKQKKDRSQNLCDTEVGTCGYEIFKNYPRMRMTVTDLSNYLFFGGGGNFQYQEESPNMKWEIKSDTLTILSYLCQKAVTVFRGRVYEAWFTTGIPINNGPWKFGGLPGLILKVSDIKQYFVFECIGLERIKDVELIKLYDLKYTPISRAKLNKLYKELHDDEGAYRSNRERFTIWDSDPVTGKPVKMKFPKQPYNPIELE